MLTGDNGLIVWERVKAIIEPLLAQHKAERLWIERVDRFVDRLRLLEEVCVDLIEWLDIPGFPEPTGCRGPLADDLDEAITKPLTDRSRNHSWHLYLPDHHDILEQLPALQSLILADDDSSDSTMQQRMRAILSERFYDHEETEQQWLPKHWVAVWERIIISSIPSEYSDQMPFGGHSHEGLLRSQLAPVVFRCRGPDCQSSHYPLLDSAIITHRCRDGMIFSCGGDVDQVIPRPTPELSIDRVGCEVALRLAWLQDPQCSPLSVTVAAMDRVDARFVCMDCPLLPKSRGRFRKPQGRDTMSWRECVSPV